MTVTYTDAQRFLIGIAVLGYGEISGDVLAGWCRGTEGE
jgi:hypothetical protein